MHKCSQAILEREFIQSLFLPVGFYHLPFTSCARVYTCRSFQTSIKGENSLSPLSVKLFSAKNKFI